MARRGGASSSSQTTKRRGDSNQLRPSRISPENKNSNNNDSSYEALVQKYARPIPRRSLLKCCSESLPVVQEFSLSVFFWARYQLSARWEEIKISHDNHHHHQQQDEQQKIETRLDWAHGCILAGFLLVIAFRFQKQETLMKGTGTKARHRLTDACLLGVLLRLLASVLRRLTASYSSDTVEALTMACMGLHLLSCDYTYTSSSSSSSGRQQQPPPPPNHPLATTALQKMNDKNRPPFQGGTVSLNASFLATVLCISRLESDLTSYFFCSLAVIFFGFYPQTRADLMVAYPPHQSVAVWAVTMALIAATCVIVGDIRTFILVVVTLLFILPTWRYASQSYKRRLDGPWSLPTNLFETSYSRTATSGNDVTS